MASDAMVGPRTGKSRQLPPAHPGDGKLASRGPSGPRAEANRVAILKAAREYFVVEGFSAPVDGVAELAGVSKVTIYNHFGSKEELCLAVIDEALSEALDAPLTLVAEDLASSSDLRAALISACRAWVSGLGTREMLRMHNAVVGELRHMPSLATEWARRGPERFHPVIGAALGRIASNGRLSIPDIDLAVLQLAGLVLSPTLVYGAYGRPPSPNRQDKLIVAGVDMFLRYYGYQDE